MQYSQYILSFIYCIAGCYALWLVSLPFFSVLVLSMCTSIYSAIIGMVIGINNRLLEEKKLINSKFLIK